jgi:uncharacterized protein
MAIDLRILLLLVPLVAGLLGKRRVAATFADHQQVPTASGADGWSTAHQLLGAHGMTHVRIERSPGHLSDHFDSDAGTVRLSADVADGASVAAVAVAAHEVAHAHQDATGHRLYRARMRIGRPVLELSRWSGIILIGGFWLGIPVLQVAAGLLLAGLAVFAVVTLPVELSASRQAVRWLEQSGLVAGPELPGVRRVLRAAAFTYVAAMGHRLGLLLFILLGVVVARG